MKKLMFNKTEAIKLLTSVINKLVNIKQDEYGYFFYTGSFNNIEHHQNRNLIIENFDEFKSVFKHHSNWYNLKKSQKLVGNLIKWCFCKIEHITPYPCVITKIPKLTIYRRKYYIPKCIIIDDNTINKSILTFN